ncbi:IPExxxVDY family protein [Fluviicola sp.]|uniref:IPExxxVDY family protein n=1 Tax=Fluviicola sp. TaxID=1917219 RepID=UPI0031DF3B08
MSKQKRHVLSLETSVDFELIGICSHHSDYRLAWGINKILELELTKSEEPFVIQSKKGTIVSQHSFHVFIDEVDHMEWYLIKNKCEGKFLIPEKNQIDYFLILRENVLHDLDELVEKIRESNSVMAAYVFEAESIPSAELIIFE